MGALTNTIRTACDGLSWPYAFNLRRSDPTYTCKGSRLPVTRRNNSQLIHDNHIRAGPEPPPLLPPLRIFCHVSPNVTFHLPPLGLVRHIQLPTPVHYETLKILRTHYRPRPTSPEGSHLLARGSN